MITTILLVCALVAFLLDAFRVQASVNWTPLGYAFLVAAVVAWGK